MSVIEETKNLLLKTKDFLIGSPWRGELTSAVDNLLYKVEQPCELAVFGTVKAGKSTFINTLLEKDLAVVNVTEATATINYFKYAPDPKENGKVIAVYNDGHTEIKDKAFLDSLQGNTPDVLERSREIDRLELYIHDDVLRHITIVDTPGTHSVVEEHSRQTGTYAAQAARNEKASVNIKNKADAVILLIGMVGKAKDKENVHDFATTSNPFNSIGIISKIDIDENMSLGDWQQRSATLGLTYRDGLHSVHPVSSGVYRTVKSLEQSGMLIELYRLMQVIKGSEYPIEEIVGYIEEKRDSNNAPTSSIEAVRYDNSDEQELSRIGLDYSVRLNIIKTLPVPSIRKRVLVELYNHPYEISKKQLLDYSGFEEIKTILNQQFFDRSYAIRCHNVLQTLQELLSDIKRRRISELETMSKYRPYYLKIINQYNGPLGSYISERERIIDSFKCLIDRETYSSSQIEELSSAANDLLEEAQKITSSIDGTNNVSEGLLLLESNRKLFSEDEITELELLFGKYPDRADELKEKYRPSKRFNVWKKRAESTTSSNIKRISELARDAWSYK